MGGCFYLVRKYGVETIFGECSRLDSRWEELKKEDDRGYIAFRDMIHDMRIVEMLTNPMLLLALTAIPSPTVDSATIEAPHTHI